MLKAWAKLSSQERTNKSFSSQFYLKSFFGISVNQLTCDTAAEAAHENGEDKGFQRLSR